MQVSKQVVQNASLKTGRSKQVVQNASLKTGRPKSQSQNRSSITQVSKQVIQNESVVTGQSRFIVKVSIWCQRSGGYHFTETLMHNEMLHNYFDSY